MPERTAPSPAAWRPFFARIAGLPATVLAELSAPELAARTARLLELEEQAAELRHELAERLHARVPGAPRDHRRFLLAVRRDAFQGEPLRRHRRRSHWARLVAEVPQAGELAALEDRLAQAHRELATHHRSERLRQQRRLLRQAEEPAFRRGVALASPALLAHGLTALAGGVTNGRALRTERSLWRYTARAAAKLSPFSSLTVIGLGEVGGGAQAPDLLVRGGWRAASARLQVQRRLPEAWRDLLLHAPPLRDRSAVGLNPSVVREPDGSFRFLRPPGWVHDEGVVRYRPLAWVRLAAQGAVVDHLLARLADGAVVSHPQLLAELERALTIEQDDDARRQVAELVDALARAGWLVLRPPFASHQPGLEEALLAVLREEPGEAVAPAVEQLGELVERERRLPGSAHPEREIAALQRALPAVLEGVLAAVRLPAGTRVEGLATAGVRFYEDVFVTPADGSSPAVVEISPGTARELLRLGELLLRFANLYNHRHDLLHAYEAAVRERWPGRRRVAAHEVFAELQELWKAYLRFDAQQRHSLFGTFDPLGLAAVARLRTVRERLHRRLRVVRSGDGSARVDPRHLAGLCADIPARYAPQTGACLFVQPADPEGRTWVLNRLFEGTGRYASRYVHAMDAPLRARYGAHMVRRSRCGADAAGLPLLDLMYPRHSTVNLHPPQTEKVLGLPGEDPHLPPHRVVPLHELTLAWDDAGETLRLTDAGGAALLPVHLSSLGNAHLPPVLKFLSVFGPYELRQVLPGSALKEDDGGVSPRLLLDRLVLRRRCWRLPPPALDAAAGDVERYLAVRRWAAAAGLPERVFVAERTGSGRAKPLYVDLTSPIAVADLAAVAGAAAGALRIEEALPEPAACPRGEDGVPRALELQIDAAALDPVVVGPRSAAGVIGETAAAGGGFPPPSPRAVVLAE